MIDASILDQLFLLFFELLMIYFSVCAIPTLIWWIKFFWLPRRWCWFLVSREILSGWTEAIHKFFGADKITFSIHPFDHQASTHIISYLTVNLQSELHCSRSNFSIGYLRFSCKKFYRLWLNSIDNRLFVTSPVLISSISFILWFFKNYYGVLRVIVIGYFVFFLQPLILFIVRVFLAPQMSLVYRSPVGFTSPQRKSFHLISLLSSHFAQAWAFIAVNFLSETLFADFAGRFYH